MVENEKLPGEKVAVVLFWLGWVFLAVPVLGSSIALGQDIYDQAMHGGTNTLFRLLASPIRVFMESTEIIVIAVLMFVGSAFLKLMVRLVKSSEKT